MSTSKKDRHDGMRHVKVRLGIEDTNQAHENPSLQAVEPLVGKIGQACPMKKLEISSSNTTMPTHT